jgi:hypothetical protein
MREQESWNHVGAIHPMNDHLLSPAALSESGNLKYSITARRTISGLVLNHFERARLGHAETLAVPSRMIA